MYLIMRKLKGYTHNDFLYKDFTAAQYFLLIGLVQEELKREEKLLNKTKKGKKRR